MKPRIRDSAILAPRICRSARGTYMRARGAYFRAGAGLLAWLILANLAPLTALAQAPAGDAAQPPAADAGPGPASMEEAAQLAEAALAAEGQPAAPEESAAPRKKSERPSLLELQLQGGPVMIPLALLSLVVMTYSFERAFALRRNKTIPKALVADLGALNANQRGMDPRRAYRVCQKYPSAAATVIRAALLKVGRPQTEIEQTVRETMEQEGARMYANVRPMTLALAIGPLLGLLGTIQGMIEAFYQTASGLGAGGNRAAELAGGIYHALITTFAGISIAIPAAVLAHYFEGKIQKTFLDMHDLLRGILPQLERYEGKLRVGSSEDGELSIATVKEKSTPRATHSAEQP